MPRSLLLVLAAAPAHAAFLGAPATPYPKNSYDPSSAAAYYRVRPVETAARALEIGLRSAGFAAGLLSDYVGGNLDANADERAAQLTSLLTTLGPTFIKVGQSASVRTDLLPLKYIEALTALQEDVPPFSSDEARDILAAELGASARRLTGMSREPIAAASLGQVYKAELDGQPVAVKVQRPQIQDRIALDMHLVRDYAAPLASLVGVPGDLVGTADAWGQGFVAELDYGAEAANAESFNDDIADGPLAGAVFAPKVVREASSRRVLTTEWVDGERLDRAQADDVASLCSLAMNCYMEMMLGTGTLHCDPHPGNLLRTKEGKLCILDWGLVSTLDADLQLTLIEHVANLVARDYAKVPDDLVKLGFVPPGAEGAVRSAGVVEYLTDTYSTWASGGGAAKFDVPALLVRVRGLAATTPGGIFQVPPYFAYIAKSFSVLEGIGLSYDPEYSIVNETLPYVSRRLLSDPSARTAGALETFVFGEGKGEDDRVIDAGRVETLLDGARRYATTAAVPGSGADGDGDGAAGAAAGGAFDAEAAAEALLDVLTSQPPTPLSDLVTEQLVLVLAAGTRDIFARVRERSGRLPGPGGAEGEGRSVLGTVLDPLGVFRGSPLVQNDERDRAALAAAAELAAIGNNLLGAGSAPELAAGGGGVTGSLISGSAAASSPVSAPEAQKLATALTRKAFARRDELPLLFRRLAAEALDQTAARLARPRRL